LAAAIQLFENPVMPLFFYKKAQGTVLLLTNDFSGFPV
jgi:hypothetical protein